MRERFAKWNEQANKTRSEILSSEDREARAERRRLVERSTLKVDAQLGVPTKAPQAISIWAGLIGLGAGVIPWMWIWFVALSGFAPAVVLLWVFQTTISHTLIALALRAHARYNGVADKSYWLWTLAGVPGLLLGLHMMRRSEHVRNFLSRRQELIERDIERETARMRESRR